MEVRAFLNNYQDFILDSGLSKYSSDQYKSYLRGTDRDLAEASGLLEKIALSSDANDQAAYAEQMNAVLTKALKDEKCPVSRKHLHNYKSAVATLIAFVSEMDWEKGKGAVAKPTLVCASEYDRGDIRRIFRSRVKTQDRLSYAYGVFAARILSKIAARHKVKLFDLMIENVKFLISPDGSKFIRLKNLDKLVIATDGQVYVESKGKTYPLYTEVVKEGVSCGYKKANVASMRGLSLDHDTPLYHALKAALDAMPEYKKLSDSVKDYMATHTVKSAAQLSRDYVEYAYPVLGVCENTILKEVGAFLDNTAITVMYTPYNSSKSKGTAGTTAV